MNKLTALAEGITKKMKEIRDAASKEGKTAILETANEIFEKHPSLAGIRWCQYTPYFNDGEPCEFDLYDLEVLVKPTGAEYDAVVARLKAKVEEKQKALNNYTHTHNTYGYYRSNPLDEVRWAQEELNDFLESGGDWTDGIWNMEECPLKTDLKAFQDAIHGIGDSMELVFGDHVRVVINRDGVEVEEYDHD